MISIMPFTSIFKGKIYTGRGIIVITILVGGIFVISHLIFYATGHNMQKIIVVSHLYDGAM